jgi:hypothetical protein
MRWAGLVARIGAMRNAYKIIVRKIEGKRAFGKPGRSWEDKGNDKMDHKEIEWEVVCWTGTSG